MWKIISRLLLPRHWGKEDTVPLLSHHIRLLPNYIKLLPHHIRSRANNLQCLSQHWHLRHPRYFALTLYETPSTYVLLHAKLSGQKVGFSQDRNVVMEQFIYYFPGSCFGHLEGNTSFTQYMLQTRIVASS